MLCNSQKYSHYLPLQNSHSATTSPDPTGRDSVSRRGKDKERDNKSRSSAEALVPPRRRATLNSRDYYDEDEALRQAIEESKKDGAPSVGEVRKNKRSRSQSEEYDSPK